MEPALLPEGPTDVRFCGTIVSRSLNRILSLNANSDFELADLVVVGEPRGLREPAYVAEVANTEGAAFSILFIHRDADARDFSKADQWRESVVALLTGDLVDKTEFVVPIRMTEAWTLVDGDALREVLGVTWSDSEMGLPSSPGGVEKVQKPKLVLKQILDRVSGPEVDLYARLGSVVSLEKLDGVRAFRLFQQRTVALLQSQGVI